MTPLSRFIDRSRALTGAGLLMGGIALAACAATPPTPERTGGSTAESASATDSADCAAMSELGCLDAAECTLRQGADQAYFCAPAANECEFGFRQRLGRQEDCAEGCAFTPAQCYCAPDVTCVCGGGPPALCTTAS